MTHYITKDTVILRLKDEFKVRGRSADQSVSYDCNRLRSLFQSILGNTSTWKFARGTCRVSDRNDDVHDAEL